MKGSRQRFVSLVLTAIVLAAGSAGSASAGGGTTFCGYQEVDGTEQWVRSYVGRRQCPATDESGGMQGYLVYSEYIA